MLGLLLIYLDFLFDNKMYSFKRKTWFFFLSFRMENFSFFSFVFLCQSFAWISINLLYLNIPERILHRQGLFSFFMPVCSHTKVLAGWVFIYALHIQGESRKSVICGAMSKTVPFLCNSPEWCFSIFLKICNFFWYSNDPKKNCKPFFSSQNQKFFVSPCSL